MATILAQRPDPKDVITLGKENFYRGELVDEILKTLGKRAAEDRRLVEDHEHRKKYAQANYKTILEKKPQWRAEKAAIEDLPALVAHINYRAYAIDIWLKAREELIRLAEDVDLDIRLNGKLTAEKGKEKETPEAFARRRGKNARGALQVWHEERTAYWDEVLRKEQEIMDSELPEAVKMQRVTDLYALAREIEETTLGRRGEHDDNNQEETL